MTTLSNNQTLQPYLFFSGRCEEAIEFYRHALDAKVEMMMRFKDSPDQSSVPPGAGDNIMHATFHVGSATLMASDGCPGEKTAFEGFGLSLTVPSESEATRFFNALAEGGTVRMPLSKTFYSPCFGMVADRFGLLWMLMVPFA
jgi:PhnB protein